MSKPELNNNFILRFEKFLNPKYKITFRCKCGKVVQCNCYFKTTSKKFRKFLFEIENQCIRKGFKK